MSITYMGKILTAACISGSPQSRGTNLGFPIFGMVIFGGSIFGGGGGVATTLSRQGCRV